MLHKDPDNKKQKKDKKSYHFFGLFQDTSHSSTAHTSFVCTEDQCTLRPVQTTPSTLSLSYFTSHSENEFDTLEQQDAEENSYLSKILPPDYLVAMKQAAQQGFLYSFVSATPVHLLNDYFKSRNMTQDQIFYANQTIRAIATLSLSAYLGLLDMKSLFMSIGIPMSVMGLKIAGINEAAAQMLPMAVVITGQLVYDMSNAAKLLTTVATAAGTGWFGNRLAKMGSNFVKNIYEYAEPQALGTFKNK